MDKECEQNELKLRDFDIKDIHLVGSAGCLEYLTIANLYLFINNNWNSTWSVIYY